MKRVFTTVEHFEGGVHMHTSYKTSQDNSHTLTQGRPLCRA